VLKRLVVFVFSVACATSVIAATSSPATAESPTRNIFTGASAYAMLSNCGDNPPVGTHCTSLQVVATQGREQLDGESTRTEVVSVRVDEVVITAIPDAPSFTYFGAGESVTGIDVWIDGGLQHASATADDIQIAGPGGTLSLDVNVTWTGVGPINHSRFRYSNVAEDGTRSWYSVDLGAQDADVTAVVNGETFSGFLPSWGGTQLLSSRYVSFCHGTCVTS
jgi:hypothetical protein